MGGGLSSGCSFTSTFGLTSALGFVTGGCCCCCGGWKFGIAGLIIGCIDGKIGMGGGGGTIVLAALPVGFGADAGTP